MRKFRPTTAAVAVALAAASGSAVAQYSNIFVVGDSSADVGYYNGARFTVNPGLVFPQVLGQRYGIPVTASPSGGTGYAAGGARVTQSPGYPPQPPTNQAPPASAQISNLLASHPALDPSALYVVSIGYNDIFTNVVAASQGQLTPQQAQANVGLAATQAAQQVARLAAAGARNLVVLNLYDTGKAPGGASSPATFSGLTTLYNGTMGSALQASGLQLISVDTNKLFNEILANPASFGLSNVTTPACTVAASLQCTTSTLVAPNAGETYLFADAVHPTPAGHAIMAGVIAAIIEGPSRMSLLTQAPLAVEDANFRTLDARMMSGINSSRPMSKYEMWVAYDYSNNDIKSTFGFGDADVNTLTAGGDVKLSEKLIAGAMVGYSENKGDFGGNSGNYKLKETSATFYAGYGDGPWYIGGTMGIGDLDYSVNRNIQLGPFTRTESGDPSGWHFMASVLGGYWFQTSADLQHGPFVRVDYQDIRVKAFTEQGSNSTALSYSEQKSDSLITSLGWQATGRLGMFRPFGRLSWEFQSDDGERSVTATPLGTTSSYTVPGYKPDDNWLRWVVGASADFGGVTGFITGAGTADKNDGDYYAITVGVRIPM